MNQSYKARLEKEHDISIFNFQHFSSNAYKASFSYIYSPTAGENRKSHVLVKRGESYKAALERNLAKNA